MNKNMYLVGEKNQVEPNYTRITFGILYFQTFISLSENWVYKVVASIECNNESDACSIVLKLF